MRKKKELRRICLSPRFHWSPRRDLNPQPTDYKSVALPLSYGGTYELSALGCQHSASLYQFSADGYLLMAEC